MTRQQKQPRSSLAGLYWSMSMTIGIASLAGISFAQETPPAPATQPDAAPTDTPATTPAPADAPAPAPAEMQPAAPAEATAPSAAPAAAPAAAPELRVLVEEYWHYGKVARYDQATAAGQKIIESGANPADILVAFEMTARDRKDNLDEWLLRWQEVDEMKGVTAQLTKVLNDGRYTRRSDPAFIQENIKRLATNERGYVNGMRALRDCGELAVPFLVQELRDPAKASMQPIIRRALRDLGRDALNPLVAATEMKDYNTLPMICTSLGDLGYDVAVPYLARLAQEKDLPPAVRKSASDAVGRIMGVSNATASNTRGGSPDADPAASAVTSMNVAQLFYQLAEKFYYDTAAIAADPRNTSGYVWYWNADRGLTKIDVPPAIFNELMAMRECEYALKLGGSAGDALSLWLASNYKREVELPAGTTDATRAEGQPDAHYYGVSAGARYLNAALARGLKDHNAQLALKVILSLQDIAGESNALPGGGGPLVDAMAYPDRVVRIEAAFAVASSLPQHSFQGQNRVVPLLAEALAQTGQPAVLIAAPNSEQVNTLREGLKAAGFLTAGATSADSASGEAESLPSVDVVIISDELPAPEVERLLASNAQSAKLAGAAKLVMVKTAASPYEARKEHDPMISTTLAIDAAGLQPAIDAARKRSGALPVDAEVATNYAMRAGILLSQLAISRGQVLDLSVAQPTLLGALNDQRPDIVKVSGNALGLFPTKEAQIGLLTVAGDEKTSDDVKISLYNSLSTSAKFFGNLLDAAQVEALTKVVAAAANLQVRSAAAEAHGALNLPADQAKSLILDQSKM